MGKLTCDLCGGNHLTKEKDTYICADCGRICLSPTPPYPDGGSQTKRTAKLQNLYLKARKARDANYGESAIQYYQMILEEDTTSWEATFYIPYCTAMQCKIQEIKPAIYGIKDCFPSLFPLLKATVEDQDEQENILCEITFRLMNITTALHESALQFHKDYPLNTFPTYAEQTIAIAFTLRELGHEIAAQFAGTEHLQKLILKVWKRSMEFLCGLKEQAAYPEQTSTDRKKIDALILRTAKDIQSYDPTYMMPANKKEGCYIATALYGSYDCPQVRILRRFRDTTLAKSWYGRTFIRVYYRLSPVFVRWFGNTKPFRRFWKKRLDHIVERLRVSAKE